MRTSRTLRYWLGLASAVVLAASCSPEESTTEKPPVKKPPTVTEKSGTTVSTTILIDKSDKALWVVNQDSDSVSVVDPKTRKLVKEIPLGEVPEVDPTTQRYEPKITPRALTLVNGSKVYVAGQSANRVYVVDVEKQEVTGSIPVPASPVGIAAAADGSAVYVVSHEAAIVSHIDPEKDVVVKSVPVTEHPWGVTVSPDGKSLFVTHILLDAGVTTIDAGSLTVKNKVVLADEIPTDNKLIPNGVPRGLFGVTPRPKTGELWVPYLLLAVDTAQPALDFESTVFPTVSTLSPDGSAEARRLLFRPAVGGAEGAFTDVISGPRSIAFTPSGKLAIVANAQSEDVMVFNAETGFEVARERPLPSALLEGIVIDHAGKHAYVEGRNTHDISVLTIDESDTVRPARVDGAPINRITTDPMPAQLRLGQRLFNTANTAAYPVTKNFWVACASCHLEGGSDAVTWLFDVGPRDTPSNAGGHLNTGFLLRQALLNSVTQYDTIIVKEQGGDYSLNNPAQVPHLEALAAYVNLAIPYPQNPNIAPDGKLTEAQTRGKNQFTNLCSSCHTGPYYTDSGAGNPNLAFDKPIVLHDIGTCVTKKPYDKPAKDAIGVLHTACDFDTPTLRGIFATAPYFHDGSSPTLRDVVDRLSFSAELDNADKEDLVAYLLTL